MRNAQLASEPLDSESVLAALQAFKRGDFLVRLPSGLSGIDGEIANTFNDIAEFNERITGEIARVMQAVARGDLMRRMPAEVNGVPLQGQFLNMVAVVNAMLGRLNGQDWLKANFAKLSRFLQGQGDLETVSKLVLAELVPLFDARQGVIYIRSGDRATARLQECASHVATPTGHPAETLRAGQDVLEQCALERKRCVLEGIPDAQIRIASAADAVAPASIVVLPVLFEGEVKAVVELASMHKFDEIDFAFFDQLTETIGIVFNTIEADMRTRQLLAQSQSLTRELQSQQEELREKAEQLAVSSRYKSEFLANMSHELRTPLNSLLILARLLTDSGGANLTPKQIDYAQTIHAAGTDLLFLINDILDLAKIESGTVTLDIAPVRFVALREYVERTFRQIAQSKGLHFLVELGPALPPSIRTDGKRLQQVLKNLLSNAFKFTERGGVALQMSVAKAGWTHGQRQLDAAATVVAFSVKDTGIGIPESARKIIFEAFQQADGTTNRKFGGTGLGLSISRELTRRLGGEICVESVQGEGSTFTIYLPLGDTDGTGMAAPAPPARADRFTPTLPGRFERGFLPTAGTAGSPPEQSADDRATGTFPELSGKKILIIDDDIRNIFALTGALEVHGLDILNAESGIEGVDVLQDEPGIDAVLVDIMMPEIDGYATIRAIRALAICKDIPIFAVTAKAMKGDREKCIAAGASDYVAKPVDVLHLLSLFRAWLPS